MLGRSVISDAGVCAAVVRVEIILASYAIVTNTRTDRISDGVCVTLVKVESTLLAAEGRSMTY